MPYLDNKALSAGAVRQLCGCAGFICVLPCRWGFALFMLISILSIFFSSPTPLCRSVHLSVCLLGLLLLSAGYLHQDDILDLQLQRNLEYLDQQVGK